MMLAGFQIYSMCSRTFLGGNHSWDGCLDAKSALFSDLFTVQLQLFVSHEFYL